MNSPASPAPSRSLGSGGTTRRIGGSSASARAGTNDEVLVELRNAAATFDHLCEQGDPVQFWEALRLAKNRRCVVAPADGPPAPPAPAAQADLVKELASIRRQMSPMVASLRRFLKQVSGLPEPADRLEMALAFLLVSPREQQALAKWTDPALHGPKAAEKLRSLAGVTDPYREALQPWTLKAAPPPAEDLPEVTLDVLRRSLSCCEIFDGMQLGAALWETLFLLSLDAAAAGPAVDRLVGLFESGRLEEAETDAERLYGRVKELRSRYGRGVEQLGNFLTSVKLLPPDECAFDVALALLLATPGSGPELRAWLETPEGGRERLAAQLKPFLPKAESLLQALDSGKS
jgi:hypothetical protein